MTEEPYRWLEAIGNRREYVREQLKGGSPVFATASPDGILLLGALPEYLQIDRGSGSHRANGEAKGSAIGFFSVQPENQTFGHVAGMIGNLFQVAGGQHEVKRFAFGAVML